MGTTVIQGLSAHDMRFQMSDGAGADGVHANPQYSYAVTRLQTDTSHIGFGLVFTLGAGNDLICQAIEALGTVIVGCEIEELMADFGTVFSQIADHPQYRWLGPHKGVVHLALASITNACFDLWAKSRGVPLWKLLLDLSPEQIVALLDLRYLDEVLRRDDALKILQDAAATRAEREEIINRGYPGYDTSIGWFNYSDDTIRDNARRSIDAGFGAVKLKVGSRDRSRDVRRVTLIRETIGDDVRLMVDANQQWSLPEAVQICLEMAPLSLYWVEEPTHPDDIMAHQALARAIAPTAVALGEHVSHRVLFKNFMQAGAMRFVQVDCTRVGGISEFITVSLMARKFGLPVIPHVGDMGQIHQHLVLFNHIALNTEPLFLEYIPHLREHFSVPANVSGGVYHTPQQPGSSADLVALA